MIVLAAGAGTRMGEPKALMEVRGTPWWALQQRRLNEIAVDQVWVFSPHVRRVVQSSPNTPSVMAESDSCNPMFASIAAGLNLINFEHYSGIFVLPIDVPAPSPMVWRALSDTDQCAVPEFQGKKGHPVYLPTEWVQTHLRPALPDPDARLDRLLAGHLTLVPTDDSDTIRNLNSPADLQQWRDDDFQR